MRVLALLVLLVSRAGAQSLGSGESLIDIKDLQSCGLITRFPGDIIQPNCFQQENNILSDRTGVPTRRMGYSQYTTVACPGGQAIRGMWPFYSDGGTQYLVMLSSNSMFYSPGDGTCNYITGLQGAITGTATMECVQSGASAGPSSGAHLWCTDGIDPVFATNVTSTQAVTQAPTGYHIGTFRNRIVISGIPGVGSNGSGSEFYMSGELNGVDYTIPPIQLSTSPAIISVNGINDGQIVTCLMGEYQNQFLVGRPYDLWGLSGYDLTDFSLRKISGQVGCLEPRSVQEVTNVLYWLSHRGVEGYTGTQINRVSYPIDSNIIPVIAAAGNTTVRSLSSQTDWLSGNLTASGPGAPMSALISPGDVVPSTFGVTESGASQWSFANSVNTSSNSGSVSLIQGATAAFTNAGFESNSLSLNWDPTVGNSGSFGCGGWSKIQGGSGVIFGTLSMVGCEISCSGSCSGESWGLTFSILDPVSLAVILSSTVIITDGLPTTAFTINTSTLVQTMVRIKVDSRQLTGGVPDTGFQLGNPSIPFVRGTGVKVGYSDCDGAVNSQIFACWDIDESHQITSGTYTTARYDTGFSTPTWGAFNATFSSSTTGPLFMQTQVSRTAAGPLDAAVPAVVGVPISSAKEFVVVSASFSVIATTNTPPAISSIALLATTTGYYITPCIQVNSPTSYGNFLVDGVTNGGSFTFWISTGSTCGSAIASTATWNLQTVNSVIAVTTSTTYIAARVLFNVDSATETPTLNDMTFTWNQGGARPPTASAQWDDRYLLFYTTSTSLGASNDHAFVYDQNQKWELWDDQYAASASLLNNVLYTGDSRATGLAYQQDVGQSDNGGSFTMTFQTADLDGGDPNMNKEFSRAYVFLGAPSANNASASLSCS